eukprot:m.178412 g.178412  ORF g.178412 m.178412 type:complete len:442 (+) comp17393_c0_seq4:96-1421(+)
MDHGHSHGPRGPPGAAPAPWYSKGILVKIMAMMIISTVYACAEIAFALKLGSLAMFSDGLHNVSDGFALMVAFWAERKKLMAGSSSLTYGWRRTEVLGGLFNGLFLVSMSIFVLLQAVPLFITPDDSAGKGSWVFIYIAAAGIGMNLLGTLAFMAGGGGGHHGHSHGGGGGGGHHKKKESPRKHAGGYQSLPTVSDVEEDSDSHNHHGHAHDNHSHDGGHDDHDDHGHGHGHNQHGHSHSHGSSSDDDDNSKKKSWWQRMCTPINDNMHGVFLHVLADTLGSVGVLTSSLLIDNFGLFIADPICSLLISFLIFASVIPLIQHSASVLLLRTPRAIQRHLPNALAKIQSVEGVLGIQEPHFWEHAGGKIFGTLHVVVSQSGSEQRVLQLASGLLKEYGVPNLCVQVETEANISRRSALFGSKYDGLKLSSLYAVEPFSVLAV